MAHSHAHAHGEGEGTYFLDQLFTILACGGVGLVAVLMYQTGMLGRILVPMFFIPVLLGGTALLVMVAIRAVAIWQLAGARRAAEQEHADYAEGHEHGHSHSHGHAHSHDDCGHEHSHGADCEHDHGHAHAHDHAGTGGDDHGHDHNWAPWRYLVLAIPVFLFFLGLPREGLNGNQVARSTGADLRASPNRHSLAFMAGSPAMTRVLRKAEPRQLELRFKELSEMAAIPGRREDYDGDIGIIRGQFIPIRTSDREFTLLRVNRTCCAADETYLETRIQSPEPIHGFQTGDWVRVEGVISFQQTDRGKWIPVITLKGNEAITPTDATSDVNSF
jgi:hypothetical protein